MCIGNLPVPQEIIDKIIMYHTDPVNKVREEVGFPVYASEESGFRPYVWEIARGRSGTSEHCYGQKKDGTIDPDDKGAVDWTCENFATNKGTLLASLKKHTKYTRFAMYDGFIHCDFKAIDGYVYEFTSNAASQWAFKQKAPIEYDVT